jgi:putative transposase
MQCTFILQLYPSVAQELALLETMRSCNAAAEDIVRVAIEQRTGSRVALQRLCYSRIRGEFRLPAQLVVGAIGKASEAYKVLGGSPDLPVFAPDGAIAYDHRVLRVVDLVALSLATTKGRIVVPFAISGIQRPHLHAHPELSYLLLQEGIFFCALTREVPGPTPQLEEIVMIDLGIRTGTEYVSTWQRETGQEGVLEDLSSGGG